MRKLIIFVILVWGIYHVWQVFGKQTGSEPPSSEPYVAVYGRESCSCTQKMIDGLKEDKIRYRFFSVDDDSIMDKLNQKMKRAGKPMQSYKLPVIDVHGTIMLSPSIEEVEEEYFKTVKK